MTNGGEKAPRQGHVVLDLDSRVLKGRKIERILGLDAALAPVRLLEVGTGSGGIAHFFATGARQRHRVNAVDVTDTRQITEGYDFTLVDSIRLPFDDASFDVVLTNHVIEHVGDTHEQLGHLREIRRIVKPGGQVYLAVPNRWMLVEPHYRLAFLSWWPRAWRSSYLRLMGRGSYYDCEPLTRKEVEVLSTAGGFKPTNVSVQAFRAMDDIEVVGGFSARIARWIPDRILHALEPIIPTHIYLLTPGD